MSCDWAFMFERHFSAFSNSTANILLFFFSLIFSPSFSKRELKLIILYGFHGVILAFLLASISKERGFLWKVLFNMQRFSDPSSGAWSFKTPEDNSFHLQTIREQPGASLPSSAFLSFFAIFSFPPGACLELVWPYRARVWLKRNCNPLCTWNQESFHWL